MDFHSHDLLLRARGFLVFETATRNLEEEKRLQAHRLGRRAIAGERLRNNDSLAHVYLLQSAAGNYEAVEAQIKTEFITDIGERSKEHHFYRAFDYIVTQDDLISDTGLSYRWLSENGLTAASQDAQISEDHIYGRARAEVQFQHAEMLADWYEEGDSSLALLASLAPEEAELPSHLAKANGFKPERQMASLWLFERRDRGLRLHAFSLDNLSLSGLQQLYEAIGIDETVEADTLSQLGRLTRLPGDSGAQMVETIRTIHDAALDRRRGGRHHYGIREATGQEANRLVEAKPETYELYRQAIEAVAGSLAAGEVTPGLAVIAQNMISAYGGEAIPPELILRVNRQLDESGARDFMDYLRVKAIPHYVFGNVAQKQFAGNDELTAGGYGGIASAGAAAQGSGTSYEGACPTSGGGSLSRQAQAEAMANSLGIRSRQTGSKEIWIWRLGRCNVSNCPSKQEKGPVKVGPCDICNQCTGLFTLFNNDLKKVERVWRRMEQDKQKNEIEQTVRVRKIKRYEEEERLAKIQEAIKRNLNDEKQFLSFLF